MDATHLLMFICGFCTSLWWQRKRGLSGTYLLVNDGTRITLEACRFDPENRNLLVGQTPYSIDMVQRVHTNTRAELYMLSAAPLELVNHTQFAELARRVVKGHLFKTGGDVAYLLQIGAAIAVMVAALYTWSSVGSITGQLAEQQQVLNDVNAVMRSPFFNNGQVGE